MLRRLSERMLRLLQGMWVSHMLVWMVMVMVMVMVDGELWQSSRVHVVVLGSDAASWGTRGGGRTGDGDGVGGGGGRQKAGMAGARGLGVEASEMRPAPHTPANPPHRPHRGPPALRVLELSEIIL